MKKTIILSLVIPVILIFGVCSMLMVFKSHETPVYLGGDVEIGEIVDGGNGIIINGGNGEIIIQTPSIDVQEEEHYHNYWAEISYSPTCSNKGLMVFSCDCGESYTEEIPMIEHTWADASCTMPKHCTVCGMTEGTTRYHSYTAATCTTPKTCRECGHTEGTTASHSFTTGTPKTCRNCGLTIRYIARTNTTTDYVNVRFSPTTNSDIITSIPPQAQCYILGSTHGLTDEYVWYRVSYGGYEGYARSDLLTIIS